MQPGQYQVREFPKTLDALRADGLRNWDARLLRRFQLHERARVSLSLDLLDLTNHTNFGAPVPDPTSNNFGGSQVGRFRLSFRIPPQSSVKSQTGMATQVHPSRLRMFSLLPLLLRRWFSGRDRPECRRQLFCGAGVGAEGS